MAKHGNAGRMDIAALDFTGVAAVTPATRKPTIMERVAAWRAPQTPYPWPCRPERDPYVWYSVDELINASHLD